MATARESVTECRICYREYCWNVKPMILPCHHSFCLECVNKLRKGKKIRCPNDKTLFDFSQIVPDFRFDEFKQALDETKEKFAKVVSGDQNEIRNNATKCELCDERPISYKCENCEQWICSYCKNIHLRAKSSRTHQVNTFGYKNKVFKDAFQKELNNIGDYSELYSKCIKKLSAEKIDTRSMQTSVLATSKEFREACILDVNNQFDHVDAEICNRAAIQVAKIDEHISELEDMLLNLESEYIMMDSFLTLNHEELVVKGHDCYEHCKSLLAATKAPTIEIDKLIIEIRRPPKWNPKLAVELEYHHAVIKQEHEQMTHKAEKELMGMFEQHMQSFRDGKQMSTHDGYPNAARPSLSQPTLNKQALDRTTPTPFDYREGSALNHPVDNQERGLARPRRYNDYGRRQEDCVAL